MFRVVLHQPEIPANTGNIARTCAAVGVPLHLIEPLGFYLTDKHLKRAGLDYWKHVELHIHRSFEAFLKEVSPKRCILFSTKGSIAYDKISYQPGDALVFGSERLGLPEELLNSGIFPVAFVPIDKSKVRCLNLATTVGICLYEAIRQQKVRAC